MKRVLRRRHVRSVIVDYAAEGFYMFMCALDSLVKSFDD